MTLDRLREMARAKRGCWVGLFPDNMEGGLEVGSYRVDNPHTTLCHLGRNAEWLLDRAGSACRATADLFCPIVAKIHGTARLEQSHTSAIVALLEGIDQIRGRLLTILQDREIRIDDTFGWTPHVTIQKIATTEVAHLPRVRDVGLRFTHISLVCGGEREHYELRG